MAIRANKSKVWKSFTKAASNKDRCNFCSKGLAVMGGQTSSLHSNLHKHGKSKNVGQILLLKTRGSTYMLDLHLVNSLSRAAYGSQVDKSTDNSQVKRPPAG